MTTVLLQVKQTMIYHTLEAAEGKISRVYYYIPGELIISVAIASTVKMTQSKWRSVDHAALVLCNALGHSPGLLRVASPYKQPEKVMGDNDPRNFMKKLI